MKMGASFTIEQTNNAYYQGKNAVWNETGRIRLASRELQRHFDQGYRDAQAEQRLDADAEWDQ
jgi:hypothetical protein